MKKVNLCLPEPSKYMTKSKLLNDIKNVFHTIYRLYERNYLRQNKPYFLNYILTSQTIKKWKKVNHQPIP